MSKFHKNNQFKYIRVSLLVGVTDDGLLKTPKEGCFYISKETRVDFLVMKLKNTVKSSTFNYIDQEFVN